MMMKILTRITQHSAFQTAKAHYDHLPSRDQNLLIVLGIFLLVTGFYLMIWEPLTQWSDHQMTDYRKQVETMEWLQKNSDKIQSAGKKTTISSSKDISTLITNTARQMGVTVYRIQPDRKGVGVWLDDAAYQKVLGWILALENKYHIIVRQIKIDRLKEEGRIKGYLHFKS
ncbi:type II secretion system protein M [Candidatus Sororendozoicomonas aggregata]|uniref:type II secretion system protein M n=1 Tax=Candidatus Sororendozoicomonas aggregata TaxID=3073239 RepID=UPI002ED6B8CD